MEVLLLRFDAPLISFGAPAVDHHRVVQRFPALSMLTGLLANALGYHHGEFKRLQRLQERIKFAARCDLEGKEVVDYQTVDLGQSFMDASLVGWTTWGRVEKRGGSSGKETHVRFRHYLAESVYSVALTLAPPDEAPDLTEVEEALKSPARPLFIGRKACIPSGPILMGRFEADTLLDAIRRALPLPAWRSSSSLERKLSAWWPLEEGVPPGIFAREIAVVDERDWPNQVHSGRRMLYHGQIEIQPAKEGEDAR